MGAYISSQNGWWDDAATWGGGGVPGDGDTATVNHIVAMRGNVTIGTDAAADDLTIGGKLKWGDPDNELGGGVTPVSGSWTLKLKCNTIIPGGGEFEIGTSSNPIPEAFTATVDIGNAVENTIVNNGTLRVHGYVSYHMASANKQRSQLVTNAAAGTSQIQTQDAVDWEAGDTLWVGTAGDKTQAPTDNEKVTILNKVNSTTYNLTGNLVNDHFGGADYGDMVIHASRNVIFTGQGSTHGFAIYKSDASGDTVFDINWCRFKYGGMGATYSQAALGIAWTSNSDHWDLAQLTCTNCVFEDFGDSNANALYFYYAPLEPDPDFVHFDEIHIFNYKYSVYTNSLRGELRFGHITAMDISYAGIYGVGCESVWMKSYWFTGTVPAGASCLALQADADTAVKIESFKIHGAYKGVTMVSAKDYYATSNYEFFSGEIYHILGSSAASYALYINGTSNVGNIIIKNVKFYDIAAYAIDATQLGSFELYSCTFDKCYRAINLPGGTAFRFRAYDCEFGTTYRNVQYNTYYVKTAMSSYSGRTIWENCKFKIPSALPVISYDWYPEELRWVMAFGTIKDWRECCEFSQRFSMEFIDCQLLDAADADQWSTLYPNTTVMGIVGGRSEIHKTNEVTEVAGYIDGSYQRKLLPFMGLSRIHITKTCPVRIPILSGQTVTAKLSLKKNINQDAVYLPMLHLFGCGITDESAMTDVVDTWDEVTVSGTAMVDGVVEFWISCWGVQDFQTIAPARTPTNDYNYAYPIDPGGVSASTGAHNLILYADGLSVERTGP